MPQPCPRQLAEPGDARLDGDRTRHDRRGVRFRQAEELAEEAPTREQLVLEDVADRRRFRMRAVVEHAVVEPPPHRGDLVDLARVDVDEMLARGILRARDVGYVSRSVQEIVTKHGGHDRVQSPAKDDEVVDSKQDFVHHNRNEQQERVVG